MKPYRVLEVRLAEVKPDTRMLPPRPAPALVTVAVAGSPGGAVILAGVLGKVVPSVGVPAVSVKPLGRLTLILETLVGVVFNLKVTSRSLPLEALMPNRPGRIEAWLKMVALAISGSSKLSSKSAAVSLKRLFCNM